MIAVAALLLLAWITVGLIYIREVRSHRRDGKLELKFWFAGLFLGLPVLTLLLLQWAWLVLTGTATKVLNHRI